ncbi:hypothetical protein ACHHYP_09598 [Achlya hypogyna]|uniref:EF-hand domain-containing protein n=1 Tax=Achlya hypogyna TaxID=1202772 RepID=A0A1V9YN27_ACHHY|nr:hypothetical protein ACHHYP_09598 [Achlya hypogyna]
MDDRRIVFEATLEAAPRIAVVAKSKKRLPPPSGTQDVTDAPGSGKIQVLQSSDGTYVLRFEDLVVHNRRRQHLYLLLCTEVVTKLTKAFVTSFEGRSERVLLDDGPDGQLKGVHQRRTFEQPLRVLDPRRYRAIVICKPAAAKPPSVVADIHLFANLAPYAPETSAAVLEAKAAVVAEVTVAPPAATSDGELSIDDLAATAHDLFRMFDRDRSGAINFTEFKAMLAYRKIALLEPQARRYFALCDEDNSGAIDEQGFVAALHMTNYLRSQAPLPLSPADAFALFDDNRDGQLNFLEYERALHCLGVSPGKQKLYRHFPMQARLIAFAAFETAWIELVSVERELAKRGLSTDAGLPRWQRAKHKAALKRRLLAALATQAAEEEAKAKEAREAVLDVARRQNLARTEAARSALHAKRAEELQVKTAEALKEREDKMQRRRERSAKAKMVQEERRLLRVVADETDRRKQALLAVKTAALVRRREEADARRAARGDDALEWAHRGLREVPTELFHGKANLTDLSLLVLVNLAHNALTALAPDFLYHLTALQKLDVSHNLLTELPETLGELTELRILNVRGNRLRHVPRSLAKLVRLEILDVSGNRLSQLVAGGLTALHVLYAGDNQLELLPGDLGALAALEVLELTGNPVARLPASFAELRHLRHVDLSSCGLRYLSTEFGHHPMCTVLHLGRNQLDHLPPTVVHLTGLQELRVSSNALLSLPDAVRGWKELVAFHGDRNQLRLLPDELGHWRRLELLELSHNRLVALPPAVGALSRLHTLAARDNRLEALPLEVGALRSLVHLNLARNALAELPAQLGYCHALRTLDVSENALRTLPDTAGMWMALEACVLHHNRLQSPLPSTVADWTELKYLDLSHNELTHLDPTLCELPVLEFLCLGANGITYLPREVGRLTSLLTLDLHRNRLRALPTELGDLLPTLEVLHIGQNPLSDLPEKWCRRWRLQDEYGASLAHGYAPAEAVEWVADHAVFYPSIVAAWNAHAALCLDHALSVATFVGLVREAVGSAWQPRFEKPVKAAFFEFKYKGHAIVLDDAPEEVRRAHAADEAAAAAAREAAAVEAREEDEAMRRKVAAKYAVDIDTVLAKGRRRHEAFERRTQFEEHVATRALQETIRAKIPMAAAREAAFRTAKRRAFASEMVAAALEQEPVLHRNYSRPDQAKWAVYHRMGQFFDTDDTRVEGVET